MFLHYRSTNGKKGILFREGNIPLDWSSNVKTGSGLDLFPGQSLQIPELTGYAIWFSTLHRRHCNHSLASHFHYLSAYNRKESSMRTEALSLMGEWVPGSPNGGNHLVDV